MSPNQNRKRPQCHTCNTPMAGHKRPNGAPICPTDDYSPPPRDHLNSRSESQTPSQTPSRSSSRSSSRSRTPTPAKRSPISLLPKRGRWINPNFIENPPPQRAPSERPGRDTPETWVSTELNEDQPLVKHEVESDDYRRSPDVVEQIVRASISSSSSSSSSSGSTRLQRTLTWIGTSTPLATVLSTPRHEITRITQRARDNGLHTAIAHFPQGNVKREISALQRQSSWWVIVGRDAGAVTHLADLHEKDAIGALDYGQRNETIGAYPAEPHYHNIGPGILVLYGLFCASCATVFIIWWMSRV